jgi:hypothetical protein
VLCQTVNLLRSARKPVSGGHLGADTIDNLRAYSQRFGFAPASREEKAPPNISYGRLERERRIEIVDGLHESSQTVLAIINASPGHLKFAHDGIWISLTAFVRADFTGNGTEAVAYERVFHYIPGTFHGIGLVIGRWSSAGESIEPEFLPPR